MTDIPTLQQPLQLPSDKQHGIGAAVKHALMFAPSMTDIMIHEGQVIRAKSARGTLPLHQLFTAIPPFEERPMCASCLHLPAPGPVEPPPTPETAEASPVDSGPSTSPCSAC